MTDKLSNEELGTFINQYNELLVKVNALRSEASRQANTFLRCYRYLGYQGGHSMGSMPTELPEYLSFEEVRDLVSHLRRKTAELKRVEKKLEGYGIQLKQPTDYKVH